MEIRSRVGIVFQNPDNQFIGSTVRDDIAFGLENHCVAQEKMDAIITEFAEKVNMTDYLESEPTRLSGGQKQRVSIARAFLKDAPILLLDEPTSAVDVETEQEIQVALREISHNRTVITIAHRRNTIADADEIYVFENGEIVRREVRTNGI